MDYNKFNKKNYLKINIIKTIHEEELDKKNIFYHKDKQK